VGAETFDLIATKPPQMPTPPDREWDDAQSRADNGGPDGWAVMDRIIPEAPKYLKPQGRLVFALFGFLGVERALKRLRGVGPEPRILARGEQLFPRIARERLSTSARWIWMVSCRRGARQPARASSSAGRKDSQCRRSSSSMRMTSI